jgi:hypothetical protein
MAIALSGRYTARIAKMFPENWRSVTGMAVFFAAGSKQD